MKKTVFLMFVFIFILLIAFTIVSRISFDEFVDTIEIYKSKEIIVEELPKGERYKGIMNFKVGDFLEVLRKCSYKEVSQSNNKEMYEVRIRMPLLDIRFKVLENGIVKYNSKFYELDPDSYTQLKRKVYFYIMLEKYSLSDEIQRTKVMSETNMYNVR